MRWSGISFFCRRVLRSLSTARKMPCCSASISSWPSCSASLWLASNRRNWPNAAASNARSRFTNRPHFTDAAWRDEIIWQLVSQVNRVFNAPAAVVLPDNGKLSAHPDSTLTLDEKELGVADWSFRQRKAAGRSTDNLPAARALHLPLLTERKTFGVLAVELPDKNSALAQRDLLETFARQAIR